MTEALNEYSGTSGHAWSLNPGDGAFYGPKIDVQVFDALKRPHQCASTLFDVLATITCGCSLYHMRLPSRFTSGRRCATVQLDFVQPMRFDLKYQAPAGEGAAPGADGEKKELYERPVMIHRAVLGSVERMIAILTEHFAGKWPFFLSPRQAQVVPVSKIYIDYALEVQKKLNGAGFYCDVDSSCRTLNKMVREAQLSQYNYILVVGAAEAEAAAVNVRTRDNEVHGTKGIDELIDEFSQMQAVHK